MQSSDGLLADDISQFFDDPYGFVLYAFPWGEGALTGRDGPDKWQTELLLKVQDVIRNEPFNGVDSVTPRQFAVTSGHGVGKSALSAWIMLWMMSTRPFSKGIVTAMTAVQLRTKTWTELRKWYDLCITKRWFNYYNSSSMMTLRHCDYPSTWCINAVTCKEENSNAFAGLHGSESSPWYLFDEASAVPNKIWEVAAGGKTDGEPFHFVFGNPTEPSGAFYDCFNRFKSRWHTYCVDSRDSLITNKKYLDSLIEDWGIEHDYIKVRILGQFPSQSSMQLIPFGAIEEARTREIFILEDEPLIMGVDVARGGDDYGVIQFRRGNDARTLPKFKLHGSEISDSTNFINIIVDKYDEFKPTIINVDGTGIGGPIHDRLIQLKLPSYDIGFGKKAIRDGKYNNKSAEMWYNMREWIKKDGCIKNHDDELIAQLGARQFGHDKTDRLLLESKKEIQRNDGHSPDDADALALTFATKISARSIGVKNHGIRKPTRKRNYSNRGT